MSEQDEVILRVNGTDYAGWKEISISAGILRQARDFTLSVTSKWPGQTDIPRRVQQGDKCEVFIGADKLLTGYVDATPIAYDATSITVGVKGRSKTADMVDCSAIHKTGQWKGVRVEKIAADIAVPYGIEVIAEADTGSVMAEHQIAPGETAFECIDRMLTARQLLVTDDAEGRAVFIKTGSGGQASTKLEYGKNILSGDAGLDYKDVYSAYLVKGQRSGTDLDNSGPACSANGEAGDNTIARYRNLEIQQHGQMTDGICADRALFEKVHRAAKALETTYTVQGWRQGDGTLWLPNQRVRVVDPVIGFDGEFLIVEVVWSKGKGGTTTSLKVGIEAGYNPVPEIKKKKGNSGWNDAGVTYVDFSKKK